MENVRKAMDSAAEKAKEAMHSVQETAQQVRAKCVWGLCV
jgi:hypothetical protein